jgi:hypothetical protein
MRYPRYKLSCKKKGRRVVAVRTGEGDTLRIFPFLGFATFVARCRDHVEYFARVVTAKEYVLGAYYTSGTRR